MRRKKNMDRSAEVSTESPRLHVLATVSTERALNEVRALLAKGNSPRIKDALGQTPLHVAVAHENLAMCQLLLDFGANLHEKDDMGRSAFRMATGSCLKLLQQHLYRVSKRKSLFRFFSCTSEPKQPMVLKKKKRKKSRRKSPSPEPEGSRFTRGVRVMTMRIRNTLFHRSSSRSSSESSVTHVPHVTTRRRKPRTQNTARRERPTAPPLEPIDQEEIKRNYETPRPSRGARARKKSEEDKSIYATAQESFEDGLEEKMENLQISTPNVNDCEERKVKRMNNPQLMAELRKEGVQVGPICARTRKLYEKKLIDVKRKRAAMGYTEVEDDVQIRRTQKFSPELELAILRDGFPMENVNRVRKLDDQLREEATGELTRFCYLLLDPRICGVDTDNLTFANFVKAVFYVGKGTKLRPLAHLIEVRNERTMTPKSPKLLTDKKKKTIDEIWDCGLGVIRHELGQSLTDNEAFNREASVIETIGLRNLTNKKAGEYHASAVTWSQAMKKEYGSYLLHLSYQTLKMEGIRPVHEKNLPETANPFINMRKKQQKP